MSKTLKWNIDKPIRGSLYWDLPLNTNFDLIDDILYKLRINFASGTQPVENVAAGSTWFDTISSCLKIKYSTGYEELLTRTKADTLYFKKTDTFTISQLYWYDSATKNMAKIYFNANKMLEFQFGNTPGVDKIVFKWLGTDGTYDVAYIKSDKVIFNKNIEVPAATSGNHPVTKSQADLAYLSKASYTAEDILTKLKTVDGTSSGIDADLLDGLHSSSFAKKVDTDYALSLINSVLTTGTVNNADKLDGFHAASFLLLSNLLTEIKKIDGAGSGIDADTLDGKHYTDFLELSGVIKIWSTSVAPSGYFECNGQAVSRTIYSKLFSVIGTTYGNGDGSTTFNLPDLRGMFIRGWDNGRGLDTQVNRAFGTVQLDTFASHTHYMFANQVINHGPYPSSLTQVPFREDGSDEKNEYTMRGTNVAATIGLTSSSGNSTETKPVNINLMYIIKY